MKKINYFLLTKSIGFYINVLSFISPKRATQKAYYLFSIPRKGKITLNSIPEILQNAEAVTLDFEGNTIQTYIWKGDETLILLIHGWESNSARWKKALPFLLESGNTIVAIDAPAHGLSSGIDFNIPKYAEFINHVAKQYKPQILIGHSIGGKACLYYQSLYQNPSIQKMVILGAPSDFIVIFKNYIKLLSLNSIIYKGLENYYLENYNLNITELSDQILSSNIITKTFIAHDKEDKIVPFSEGEKNAIACKNSIFISTKGIGHNMNDTDLYQKIVLFIAEE
ncbi:MAG: alpha/beta hydrolase [Flavobacteriaceae bacterium]|nr:alpha/beta hydrolase [Flavobacteriaceae bacterium]